MKDRLLKSIILLILSPLSIVPQNLSEESAKSFINLLIYNSEEIETFVDSSELTLSKRLEITYNEVKNKFLISNSIPQKLRIQIQDQKINYKFKIRAIDKNNSILTLEFPSAKLKLEYNFSKAKLISKPKYYSTNWSKVESKYFIFYISDSSLINEYSIKKLDKFVEEMLVILNIENELNKKLASAKIHYFLCKDEDEIELLTNYRARGIYYLPYDYIISTYNSHYHEIAHLLVNYKLQINNLYTSPILQEGLAVAFGGRGGTDSNILINMGIFLALQDFINPFEILSKSDFYEHNTSLSYPISGLFTKFLIEKLGIVKYLDLYKLYGSIKEKSERLTVDMNNIPTEKDWKNFLYNYDDNHSIKVNAFNGSDFNKLVFKNAECTIYESKREYLIKLKKPITIRSKDDQRPYKSRIFDELCTGIKYNNQKHLIHASSDEISVYNLLTNTLMAKYVKGFSTHQSSVKKEFGYYTFVLSKSLFDHSFSKELVNTVQ